MNDPKTIAGTDSSRQGGVVHATVPLHPYLNRGRGRQKTPPESSAGSHAISLQVAHFASAIGRVTRDSTTASQVVIAQHMGAEAVCDGVLLCVHLPQPPSQRNSAVIGRRQPGEMKVNGDRMGECVDDESRAIELTAPHSGLFDFKFLRDKFVTMRSGSEWFRVVGDLPERQ